MIESNSKTERSSFGQIPAPEPRYSGIERFSLYLPMQDGVRIAMDINLPGGLAPGEKIPTLLIQSRYWRSMELRAPFKWFMSADVLNPRYRYFKPFFTSRGYALVQVDVRGTGASYGTWHYPWCADSVYDAREIVNWIVAQPWSNGCVGGWGISYLGTTAELLEVLEHPAIKAIIPMFNHPDPFIDIAFPGGVFNERFIRDWGKMDNILDQNRLPDEFGTLGKMVIRGVNPVQGDRGRRMLQRAVKEHTANPAIYDLTQLLTYRDEIHPQIGACMDDMAVKRFEDAIRSANVPTFGWGSWMDAGTGDAVIRRFMQHENVLGAVGAWEHGGQFHASPYKKPHSTADPTPEGQWAEMIRFLDVHMKDGQKANYDPALHYYLMGAEIWQSTTIWPPQGTTYQRWYLAEGGSLSGIPVRDEDGKDLYEVDFEVTTGSLNRWWELSGILNKSVAYPDRSQAAEHMLTYTSHVLESDMQITGSPVVRLFVTSSEPDGAFFVYLEDVHPDGSVTYITEGVLRAIHRKIVSKPMICNTEIPQHTYLVEDGMPLKPGEVAELSFCLLPTAVLLKKGHCLRVSIAGHDKGTFIRIPEHGNPLVTIYRNDTYKSSIDLPVRGKI